VIGREDRRSIVRSVTRRSGVRFRSGTMSWTSARGTAGAVASKGAAWLGIAEGASNVSRPDVSQPAPPWDALSWTPNALWSSNVIVATVAPP